MLIHGLATQPQNEYAKQAQKLVTKTATSVNIGIIREIGMVRMINALLSPGVMQAL